jgi:prophage DNA circulation protein
MAAIAQGALLAVEGFAALAIQLSEDASLASGAMSVLSGNYGRYVTIPGVTVQPTATVASVLAGITTARTAVATAASTAEAAASNLSTATAPALATAIAALTEALRAAALNPSDQIRLMTALSDYYPTPPVSSATIGQTIAAAETATAALCRRAALISLARACAAYTPTSYDDAMSLRTQVADLIDAEMLVAADAGDNNAYGALRALRTAVINDLTTRGANLPKLVQVTTKIPMPSLALAYRLYGDATRTDDLVQRADPICPLWMPTSLVAASS